MNPLCGCDVKTGEEGHLVGASGKFWEVTAIRRVDVFVGDRPFQLVAPPGDSLGIMVANSHLIKSPIQEDITEIATDRPFCKCLEEREHSRGDDLVLRVAEYEGMAQVALDDTATNSVLTSATVSLEGMRQIELDFAEGTGLDELQDLIVSEEI